MDDYLLKQKMISDKYLVSLYLKFEEAFASQDPNLFDVVFEVEGKKLYADKFRLSVISPTFKSMLPNKCNPNNESIKIENYKFKDFKEFLTFFYSGKCYITNENVFAMLDMTEFFQTNYLKDICNEFLSKNS